MFHADPEPRIRAEFRARWLFPVLSGSCPERRRKGSGLQIIPQERGSGRFRLIDSVFGAIAPPAPPGRVSRASTPETEYGWIEPGETFGRIESDRVLQVKRFWEKPSEAQARSCLAAGHLWNTFVIVAKLSTLLEAGRRLLPQLSERLTCATRFLAAGQETPL